MISKMFRGSRIANCFHSGKLHWLDKGIGYKRDYKSAPLQERKMIDRKKIHVKGGDGGQGCTSFRKSRHDRYGEADGGRGGRGGDVRLLCTDEFWDFSHLQHHFNAKNGGTGSSKKRVGTRGEDKVIYVPMGTVIHLVSGQIPSLSNDTSEILDNINTHENREDVVNEVKGHSVTDDSEDENSEASSEVENDCSTELEYSDSDSDSHEQENSPKLQPRFVAELLRAGETFIVALGGEGGRGNASMPRGFGSRKQLPRKEHEQGNPGTEAYLALELKTIADIGFVGAPNAGKSTVLGAISRAKPKVGHYAFTTLRPNLGKLEFEDFFSITVADIPGLIKGAHKNVGLGHDFLRHVERTKALAYVIDLSAGSGDNSGPLPWIQFEDLKFELEMYQRGLSDRPTIIIGTKMDEKGAVEALEELKRRLPLTLILPVCAPLEQGIHDLRVALRELVISVKSTADHDCM